MSDSNPTENAVLGKANPISSEMAARRFRVSPTQVGQRLDQVVASVATMTRSQAKMLIDHERVWVDGESKKAGYLVHAHEEVAVCPLPAVPTVATPQNIPLDVLYEDEYVTAINKPAGMVVHPAPGQWQGTVVNALLFRWGWPESTESLRPGVVHRLDKDTSGVLLIAKNPRTADQLMRQFQERQVHKTYGAVVLGCFRAVAGEVALPIGRHPSDRKKMSVHARHSRPAVSRYGVVAEAAGVSFVHLFPETGRTHQLRVHLAALGHPLVGDLLYGSQRGLRHPHPAIQTFPRQALHAESIQFCHPVSRALLTISAPYPPDLRHLLTVLGLGYAGTESRVPIDSGQKIEYGKT